LQTGLQASKDTISGVKFHLFAGFFNIRVRYNRQPAYLCMMHVLHSKRYAAKA